MIAIDRNSIPLPKIFKSDKIRIVNLRLEEFYLGKDEFRNQKRLNNPFDNVVKKELREPLRRLFQDKCAYCESSLTAASTFGEIDNFRPKRGARGLQKEFSNDHYWWLTYQWENLYYSCPVCNRYKSTWFPVLGRRADVLTPYQEILNTEQALFVDPCVDDPKEHFWFDPDGTIHPSSEKGEATIEIIRLNREELVSERRKAINDEYSAWEVIYKNWNTDNRKSIVALEGWRDIIKGKTKKNYLGARRFFIDERLKTNPEIANFLGQMLSEEETSTSHDGIMSILSKQESTVKHKNIDHQSIESFKSRIDFSDIRTIWLDRLELNNYKCFDQLKIEFNEVAYGKDTPEAWLTFLGENGVGKSSILKAIAMCLCGEKYLNKNIEESPHSLLKTGGKQKGFIKLFIKERKAPIEIHFEKDKLKFELINPIEKPTYVLGYGSTRLLPDNVVKHEKRVKTVKIKNLFQPSVALVDARQWLLELDEEPFNRVADSLRQLLHLPENDYLIRVDGSVYVTDGSKSKTEISNWSDGYKTILALSVDMMATLERENITYDLAEGIVLIDEIGTHLHPRWKMVVVSRLRETFKRMQFIVTTHEPLCLRGLLEGEIVTLHKLESKVVANTNLPDPSKLRIDQILTSPLFGLSSVIDPETEELFDEYYSLLAKSELSKKEEKRKEELSDLIPKIKQLGDSPREELATYIIDEMLAKNAKLKAPLTLKELEPKVKERVKDIWDSLGND